MESEAVRAAPASHRDARIQGHVFRSTASNLIGQLVILGVGFLLSPFVLHRVGASDYGLWVLVNSITGYASVLEFGISSAVIKYVSEYRARGETGQARALVATALTLYTGLGMLAILFSVSVALLLSHFIQVPPEDQAKAARLVLLAGVGLGISIPTTTVVGVLRGLQRFDLLNLLYIINILLNAAATIAVLLLGWGIVGIAAVAIPVTLLTQVPGLLLIRRADPEMRIGWRGARRDLVRTVAGFSSTLFMIQIARQLQMRTDEIVIAGSLPLSSVTPYSFSRRVGEIPNQLANQFIRTLMPLASSLHAEDDWSRLRAMYLASTRLSTAIVTPVAAALSVLAPSLLTVWIGAEYARYWPVVLLIALSSVVLITQYPAGALLQGIARHRILALTSVIAGLTNLALSLLLVRRIGLFGVALGTLIPATIEAAFLMPYTARQIGVRITDTVRQSYLPALVPVIPMVAALIALQRLLQPTSLFMLGVIAAVAGLVYLPGYFFFGATAPERQMLHRLVVKAAGTARAALRL